MKKRTLMSIFAALTIGATMAAATSCDALSGLPIIGGFFGSSVEEKATHAINWKYDSTLVTVTPVDVAELPKQLEEEGTFSFKVTAKEGYTVGNVSGAKTQEDGSYKVTMGTRDININITVEKTLNEIVVEAPSLIYFEDQTVDTSLLKVTAKYVLGDEIITDYTIGYENGSAFAVGDTKFTVSFGGKQVDVELATPVTAAQEFYGAELLLENDTVYIVVQGNYNAEGTVEEAAATVKGWFNNCTERGTWAAMDYTVDVTMKADKSFTVKLNVKKMKLNTHYYFHIKDGEDGQDFTSSYANGFIGVDSAGTNTANEIVIPEGGATYVETSNGTKYYLGRIQNWGSNALFIVAVDENPAKVNGISLEVVDGKPCAVLSGTYLSGLDAASAEKRILTSLNFIDFQALDTWVTPNGDPHIQDGAFVKWGEEKDAEGNVVTEGQVAAKLVYNAADGTFKIYAALVGTNVEDGLNFFCHCRAGNNLFVEGATGSITVDGFTFTLASGADLGYSENDWQYGVTYITVSAAE